jgi:membrane protease YdiL (CAAX protease family)
VIIVQHVLAFILIFVAPVWDHFEIRKLKTSTDPRRKIKFYWLLMALTWTFSLVACAAVGWQGIFRIQVDPRQNAWLPSGNVAHSFMIGLFVAFVAGLLVPPILMRKSPRTAASMEKAMKSMGFILPSTLEQRRWWVAICATAGIGEEILYRGFLIQYFRHDALHLNLIAAVALACVIFGIAHMYQGLKGVFGTALMGVVFSAIYAVTGNLLAPMILHFLIDLRILLMLPASGKVNLESA